MYTKNRTKEDINKGQIKEGQGLSPEGGEAVEDTVFLILTQKLLFVKEEGRHPNQWTGDHSGQYLWCQTEHRGCYNLR